MLNYLFKIVLKSTARFKIYMAYRSILKLDKMGILTLDQMYKLMKYNYTIGPGSVQDSKFTIEEDSFTITTTDCVFRQQYKNSFEILCEEDRRFFDRLQCIGYEKVVGVPCCTMKFYKRKLENDKGN